MLSKREVDLVMSAIIDSPVETSKDLQDEVSRILSGQVSVSFEDDWEKMRDFWELSKDDFLASYSYLTEEEYDATVQVVGEDAYKRSRKPNYAVIFTYGFDDDVATYLFNTYEDAWDFLKKSYIEELRIAVEENEWCTEGEINKDIGMGYAKISYDFLDRTDITEIRVGSIYN